MSDVVQHEASRETGIYLSEAAKKHVLSYLARRPDCCGIRFSVKKTGCSGLSYVVDYVQSAPGNDVILPLSDAYQVYIDKASYPFLKGMSIDYVKEGLNARFVFDNPNQTGACGCGESFTVE